MSNIANWNMTAKATIWRAMGKDRYNSTSYSQPIHIMVDYVSGTQVNNADAKGAFILAKNDIYTEYSQARINDYILIGIHSDSLVPLGDMIVSVGSSNPLDGTGLPDFKLQTA